MSLMACPECKKEISDTCDACPHCGFNLKKAKEKKRSAREVGIGCLIVLGISIMGVAICGREEKEEVDEFTKFGFKRYPYTTEEGQFYIEGTEAIWPDVIGAIKIKGVSADSAIAEVFVRRSVMAKLSERVQCDVILDHVFRWWVCGGYRVRFCEYPSGDVIGTFLAHDWKEIRRELERTGGIAQMRDWW